MTPPTHGGARPGAGRKPTPPEDRPRRLTILLAPQTLRELDRRRGAMSRGAYITQALARLWAGKEQA